MYHRVVPLALVHVTFTLLCAIAGLITQQHSCWGLIGALVFSHVATAFMVALHVGQRDDDLSDDRLVAARPGIILYLVASIFALAMAGLVIAIVASCHPKVTIAALIVDPIYAGDVRDEWRYKQPTVALFLSLVCVVFAAHLAGIIWASVLVHKANALLSKAPGRI